MPQSSKVNSVDAGSLATDDSEGVLGSAPSPNSHSSVSVAIGCRVKGGGNYFSEEGVMVRIQDAARTAI